MGSTNGSITKYVLNETSGELEPTEFRTVKEPKGIRGGFRMTYPEYDVALLQVVHSSKDLEVVLAIRNMFKKSQTEVSLPKDVIAKAVGCVESKIIKVIADMVEANMLMRVRRGVYRLNPFMYLPYKAEGKVLQDEWRELVTAQKYCNPND